MTITKTGIKIHEKMPASNKITNIGSANNAYSKEQGILPASIRLPQKPSNVKYLIPTPARYRTRVIPVMTPLSISNAFMNASKSCQAFVSRVTKLSILFIGNHVQPA